MGNDGRLSMGSGPHFRWLLVVVTVGAAATACRPKHDLVEERRALLKSAPVQSDPEEQRRKQQVFDADGTVLPSDQMIAGVVLPRGLRLYASSEHDWDFMADHVSAKALERYFAPRLHSQGVTHSLSGAVEFERAQPKDDLKAPLLSLRVVALRGANDASEVFIHQTVPGKVVPPQAQVEAQLQALRDHAL
ncbi:MAG: hypothetical protein ACHQ53_02985 [Polyangiales bacterium]